MCTPHIPGAEYLQISGLVSDTTYNAGVPKNARVREHNETPDHNTAERAATDATVSPDDYRPPSTAEHLMGARRNIWNNISYYHLYNPDATAVPAFNKTNFMSGGSIEYAFEYLSEGDIEGFVLGQTAQMFMKRVIKEFGDTGVDAFHKDMKQLHNCEVPIPVDPRKMSSGSKAAALKYLMFLNMK